MQEHELTSSFYDRENQKTPSHHSSQKLSIDQIHKSLSIFNHNSEGRLAYAKISLAGLGLCEVGLLETYQFLQQIILDNNSLTSLQPLRCLKNLSYVSARHNQLTESVFSDLVPSAQTLEKLYLDHNTLRSLDGLKGMKHLTNLCVTHNEITSLKCEQFSTLHSLLQLDVSCNQIVAVDVDVFSGSRLLRRIDLSHNSIEHLHFLAYVTTNLDTLIVAHNKLSCLSLTLVQCQALLTLDLSYNSLEKVEDFIVLTPQKLLCHLSVQGNPFFESKKLFFIEQFGACVNNDRSTATNHCLDDGEGNRQFLSRSETAYEDNTDRSNNNLDDLPDPFQVDSRFAASTASEAIRKTTTSHNFANLTASFAFGLVRHTLLSCRAATTLCEINPSAQLSTFPYDRQVKLYLISILPHLCTMDGNKITEDDISRATIYFPLQPHVHWNKMHSESRSARRGITCESASS